MTGRFAFWTVAACVAAFVWAAPAIAQGPQAHDAPIVLKSVSEHADIEAKLPRAAELEPDLFRRIVADARTYMTGFESVARTDAEALKDASIGRRYTLNLDYDTVMITDNVIGILATSYEYTGGAHGNTYFVSHVYDRSLKKPILFSTLFGEPEPDAPVLSAFSETVLAELARQKSVLYRMNGLEEFDAETDPGLVNLRVTPDLLAVFTPEPSTEAGKIGGLTFHFPPYTVGAYAEGSFAVMIPQSVFEEYISESYRDAFAGVPRIGARLSVLGEDGETVAIEGIRQGDRLAPQSTITAEVPVRWLDAGDVTIRLTGSDGAEIAAVQAERTTDRPSEAGYQKVLVAGDLSIESKVDRDALLVLQSGDPTVLPRGDGLPDGPAQAVIAVRIGPEFPEAAAVEENSQ